MMIYPSDRIANHPGQLNEVSMDYTSNTNIATAFLSSRVGSAFSQISVPIQLATPPIEGNLEGVDARTMIVALINLYETADGFTGESRFGFVASKLKLALLVANDVVDDPSV